MRILPVTIGVALVQVESLDRAIALNRALVELDHPAIVELVPAARTVMIRYRPEALTRAELASLVGSLRLDETAGEAAPLVRLPVRYDGPDIHGVADVLNMSVEEVVRRHTGSEYTVGFTGFAPGFAYLVDGDPALQVPRRKSPRTVIPAGAVALAGPYSGVYPRASPGGWQLIGSTDTAMFDLRREPPALLQPGARVRFEVAPPPAVTLPRDVRPQAKTEGVAPSADPATPGATLKEGCDAAVTVQSVGIAATLQDFGRLGKAALGVSPSGAMSRDAVRRANELVGNAAGEAVIESAYGGLMLRVSGRLVAAVTGAQASITVRRGAAIVEHPLDGAFGLDDGDVLELGPAVRGAFVVVAVRGGFDVEPVLGSRSADTLSGLGPVALRAGRRLNIANRAQSFVLDRPLPGPSLAAPGDTIDIAVVLGPRDGLFTDESIRDFLNTPWTVTPSSNRVGLRLSGAATLRRRDAAELESEGCTSGSIEIPPSGQPVLFAADHPVTGGYPVIATVIPDQLDLARQAPIGARMRFRAVGDDGGQLSGIPAEEVRLGNGVRHREVKETWV